MAKGQIDRWTNKQMDRRKDGLKNRWAYGRRGYRQVDKQANGQKNRWTYGRRGERQMDR